MGAVLRLPYAQAQEWPAALGLLRGSGFRVAALDPTPRAVPVGALADEDASRLALLVGTEGAGLSPGAREHADLRVRIPMAAGADSINVATALAIALHSLRGAREAPCVPS
jgi:tRNA G18 (ribose-2'-O)-methylase SpoU